MAIHFPRFSALVEHPVAKVTAKAAAGVAGLANCMLAYQVGKGILKVSADLAASSINYPPVVRLLAPVAKMETLLSERYLAAHNRALCLMELGFFLYASANLTKTLVVQCLDARYDIPALRDRFGARPPSVYIADKQS